MSIEFIDEKGELKTVCTVPPGNSIKVVRFTVGTATVELCCSGQDGNGLNSPNENQRRSEEKAFINSMNGWLMTVATLLMDMAFTAGLNIPGGAWSSSQFNSPTSTTSNTQTDDPGHTAGRPIIMNIDRYRYYILMLFDVMAFACSMSIIVILLFKKYPEHRLLKIRNLLVYAMVMVAIVYVLGCAPYSRFILFIAGVGAAFTFIQLTFGWIIFRCLDILWGCLIILWGWLRFLGGKWDALWGWFWRCLIISGDGEQQAAA